jgi:hypothetical protein
MEREGVNEGDGFTAFPRLALFNRTPLRRWAEEIVLSARQPEFAARLETR